MSVKVNAIDHLVINVTDVARSAEWYRKILGMEVKVFDPGRARRRGPRWCSATRRSTCGRSDADKVEWFTADHETAGSDDLCFLTTSTPDEVVAHLRAQWALRSRRARLPNKAPAAPCARSIAAIPTAA